MWEVFGSQDGIGRVMVGKDSVPTREVGLRLGHCSLESMCMTAF
jgi:hypothetical protein